MKVYVDASLGYSSNSSLPKGGIGIFSEGIKQQNIAINIVGQNLNSIRLEVLAIRSALILHQNEKQLTLYTDNQHCYECLVVLREYYIKNDWKRKNHHHVAELDILLQCNELIDIRQRNNYKTEIKKIVAHSGNVYHDIADKLAYAAMTMQTTEIKNLMYINVSNNSSVSITVLKKLLPFQLDNAIDEINNECKRLNLNKQINQQLEQLDNIRYTFILCYSCTGSIMIESIKYTVQMLYHICFTQCRSCENENKENELNSSPIESIFFLFKGSNIDTLFKSIATRFYNEKISSLMLGYKDRESILNEYNTDYKIVSIDVNSSKCLEYVKSGFF